MVEIPKDIDYELTKLWISQQDLSSLTPEQVKEKFFDALHRMQAHNVERWD